MRGDYPSLTAYNLEKNAWMTRQFERPEVGRRAAQAIRRQHCPENTVRPILRGLGYKGEYTVSDLDSSRPLRARPFVLHGRNVSPT